MFRLNVVAVLPLCFMLAACSVINVNLEKAPADDKCGATIMLEKETEVTVISNGALPGTECTINFEMTQCTACFMFEKYAFFNTSLVSLTLTMDTLSKTVDENNAFPTDYVCSKKSKTLTLKLVHDASYVFDPESPGYRFTLDVYNWCGYRGQTKSVFFEDVHKHATGYHHGEEMDNRQTSQLVTGLIIGLCLASMFLVVLFFAFCYVKHKGDSKTAEEGK